MLRIDLNSAKIIDRLDSQNVFVRKVEINVAGCWLLVAGFWLLVATRE